MVAAYKLDGIGVRAKKRNATRVCLRLFFKTICVLGSQELALPVVVLACISAC